MSKPFVILALSLSACASTDIILDGGTVCIDDMMEGVGQNTADLAAGDSIPLAIQVGLGCSTQVDSAECFVEVVGNDIFITSEVAATTPGRLPWQGENLCLTLGRAPCDMPPAAEGTYTVHYGDNTMDVTVPGRASGCISAAL